MKKIFLSVLSFLLIILLFTTTSCKKEILIVSQSSIDTLALSKKLLAVNWNEIQQEREEYSGGLMIDKKLFNFANTNTTFDVKPNATYTQLYQGSPAGNGTWQLISPYYFVLDKGNPAQERYYYILLLDNANLVTHGPFNVNGGLIDNFLYTFYYKKRSGGL